MVNPKESLIDEVPRLVLLLAKTLCELPEQTVPEYVIEDLQGKQDECHKD